VVAFTGTVTPVRHGPKRSLPLCAQRQCRQARPTLRRRIQARHIARQAPVRTLLLRQLALV
jgi:hypothetical protein